MRDKYNLDCPCGGMCGLPARVHQELIRYELFTVKDLAKKSRRWLRQRKWFGDRTIKDIEDLLSLHGLQLEGPERHCPFVQQSEKKLKWEDAG